MAADEPSLFDVAPAAQAPTSKRTGKTADAGAAPFVPDTDDLQALRAASQSCAGCDLYRFATQTVFGEGDPHAPLMFVGEAPGDSEDLRGRPFVGPAGALLRESLAAADIDPAATYITNAVKHFKFVERGKRRIHATPKRIEVVSCMPWLEAEIRAIRPRLVVALGATAAQAILGPSFRVTQSRGTLVESPLAKNVVATVHPSSILRAVDDAAREEQRKAFVVDLVFVAATLRHLTAA